MSGFDIQTDHRIVPHGDDIMRLYDESDGSIIVTAARTGENWHVTSESTDGYAPDRVSAIAMLTDHAYQHLGSINDEGHGYSTLVPHGLAEQP